MRAGNRRQLQEADDKVSGGIRDNPVLRCYRNCTAGYCYSEVNGRCH